jgi:phosphatidylethanolamine N-methyltransferase
MVCSSLQPRSSILINSFIFLHLVDKPASLDFETIHDYLARVITLCLDSDPSLIPQSRLPRNPDDPTSDADTDARDPDDFRFWSENQARRIAVVIKAAFGEDYTPDVIVADANVSALANRILVSKELLSP